MGMNLVRTNAHKPQWINIKWMGKKINKKK